MNLPHDAYFEEQSNGEVWVYDSEGNRIKDTQSLTVEDVEIFIEKIGIQKSLESAKKSDINLVFLIKDEKVKYKDIKSKIFVKSKLRY